MTKITPPPTPDYAVIRAEYGWDVTYIAWNGAESSAPIYVLGSDGEWTATPYQTASARHRTDEVVRLILDIDEDDPAWDNVEYRYVDEDEYTTKDDE